MRTIAATVRTREEAEHATRRLQDLGIPSDRILVKEAEGAGQGGILISVKAMPEQLTAATGILKGGGSEAGKAQPVAGGSDRVFEDAPISHPPRSGGGATSAAPGSDAVAPAPQKGTAEPRPQVEDAARTTASVRPRAANSAGAGRMVGAAILLAASGVALGALIGTVF